MIHEPPQQIIEGATPLRTAVRPWSEADTQKLKLLWGTPGMTSRRIAAELGYNRGAIIGKAQRLGLRQLAPRRAPPMIWTQKECDNAVELWKQKLSLAVIGDRIGRSVHGLRKKLRELGFRRPPGWNHAMLQPWRNRPRRGHIKADSGYRIPTAPHTIVSKDAPWRALESAWVPLSNTTPIEFMEHTHRTCHWPIGDEYPFKWCGAARIKNCSYCQPHHDMAVQVVEG